jgi:hypothetical protein
MQTAEIRTLKFEEAFSDYRFVRAREGRYLRMEGWYPLLGLPGSIDLSSNAVLFCRLREPFEIELRRHCLNGVVNKLRIHKSGRVNGPDTMLVFVSDLINEYAAFRVPVMSEAELREFFSTIET